MDIKLLQPQNQTCIIRSHPESYDTVMKIFAINKLTHTLQTQYGMILAHGAPTQRTFPTLPISLTGGERFPMDAKSRHEISHDAVIFLFTTCVLENQLPIFHDSRWRADRKLFGANVYACCHHAVGVELMKRYIASKTRLDLEQAAAIVVAAVRNDATIANRAEVVASLLKELEVTVITRSCMWLESYNERSTVSVQERKFRRLVTSLPLLGDVSDSKNWSHLVPLLLRVRRSQPRSRCLFIPEWMFEAAGCTPPPEFRVWDIQGRVKPGHGPMAATIAPVEDNIVLSRKHFRSLQRRLLRYRRFWDPTIHLREAIAQLESEVIYAAEHIKSMVLSSQDTLIIAHYFFAIQRRLQRKVVSDIHWTGFLEKGESGNIMQNNPEIQTTFERCLGEFSGQSGVPVTGPLTPQIDQCCLLMERYVLLYGAGDRNSLVFKRGPVERVVTCADPFEIFGESNDSDSLHRSSAPETRGGSGRGAVDDYNLLCDILRTLCKAASQEGLAYPGPVRKFLAKDIMAWNRSFDDDAFANGRVPGWETWLVERRNDGLVQDMQAVRIG